MYDDQGFPIKPVQPTPSAAAGGSPTTSSTPSSPPPHPSSSDHPSYFPPPAPSSSSSAPSQPVTQMYDQHGFPIKRYATSSASASSPQSNNNNNNNPPSLIHHGGVRNGGGGAAATGVQLGAGSGSAAAATASSSGRNSNNNNPSASNHHHHRHMTNLDRAVPLDVRSDWNSSLWDCFLDCGVCLDVCICPCIEHARVGAVVVDGRQNSINAPILFVGLFFCCLFRNCTTYYLRYEVAKRYNIQETACTTLCLGCLLPWCTSCQVHREVLFRGEFPGGFFADEKPPRPPVLVAPM